MTNEDGVPEDLLADENGPADGVAEDDGDADVADPGQVALMAALLELERHVREAGWDQPPRLFALVPTDDLLASEPGLADALGLRGSAHGAPADALTAIEQEELDPGVDVLELLGGVEWPESVHGCALSLERSFLPPSVEGDIPDDPAEAAEFVAAHPERQDVRVLVAVDRAGHRHGVARIVSQPDELLAADDLVPGLVSALAHTLT
jgi:hypothetical protein